MKKVLNYYGCEVIKNVYGSKNSFIIKGDIKTIERFKNMLSDYYNRIEVYVHNGFFTPNQMQVCYVCSL